MKKTEDMGAIVRQYIKPLYNFVYRIIPDSGEVEDIIQEVFVKIWKNIKKFDPKQNPSADGFKTWIFTIARNTTIDWLRKKKSISFSQMDSRAGEIDEKSFEANLPDLEPPSPKEPEKLGCVKRSEPSPLISVNNF